jgi:hypothetical protein
MATNREMAEAIKWLLDLWKRAEASGYDPEVVCSAFIREGKAGVERIAGRAL